MIKPTNIKSVSLGDVLTKEQVKAVQVFVARKDKDGLRTYLRSISDELEKKDIVADYLYYQLCYKFKMI